MDTPNKPEQHEKILSTFPIELIVAKKTGEEIGYMQEVKKTDVDIGDKNDFELLIETAAWDREKHSIGNRVFIPNTEYGGLIEEIEVNTKNETIMLRGYTWRGLLSQKVVKPKEGESHLVLDGELNVVISKLVGNAFGDLFVADMADTGIIITNWKVDRYVTLYDAIMKLLTAYGHRLQIKYCEPDGLEYGAVHIRAEPVRDYSEELEYSRDSQINFTVKQTQNGINHLVCVGKGQKEERIVIDLYVQEDGSIGKNQFYHGSDERAAVYELSSAESDKLEEDGIKKLKELKNKKVTRIFIDDAEMELGDIVGGYEEITNTCVKKPITGKILRVSDGIAVTEYKIEGDD